MKSQQKAYYTMMMMMIIIMGALQFMIAWVMGFDVHYSTTTSMTRTRRIVIQQQPHPPPVVSQHHHFLGVTTSTNMIRTATCTTQQGEDQSLKIISHHNNNNNITDGDTTSSTSGVIMAPMNAGIIMRPSKTPLSMSLNELAFHLNGYGRAQLAWDCYQYGVDPIVYFSNPTTTTTTTTTTTISSTTTASTKWKFPSRRRNQTLGFDALERISHLYHDDNSNNNTNDRIHSNYDNETNDMDVPGHRHAAVFHPLFHRIDTCLAILSHVSQSHDGTTKLLLTLCQDGTQIETVIIPFYNEHRSTICISSQVGCQQGCTFCATGTMGKTRSLSSDEIIVQYYYAQQIIYSTTEMTLSTKYGIQRNIPPITNVVFMGMGEPSDNADAVIQATKQFTTRELFQLSASRVTVSTVAPTPAAFMKFVNASCVLAWSVHAATDALRKQLVPTTRYTIYELRQGLIDTLLLRPNNFLRTVMIEVALIDQINDSIQNAEDMAILVRGLVDAVPGCKVMVNLIPYNDINSNQLISHKAKLYRKPSMDRVLQYQKHLWSLGVYTHVRVTRGDDESAACGQLVTIKQQQRKRQQQLQEQ